MKHTWHSLRLIVILLLVSFGERDAIDKLVISIIERIVLAQGLQRVNSGDFVLSKSLITISKLIHVHFAFRAT